MQSIQPNKTTKSKFLSKINIRYQTLNWVVIIFSLVIFDLLVIGLALRTAFWIRFELSLPLFNQDSFASPIYYQSIVLLILPVWIFFFLLYGLYDKNRLFGGIKEYDRLFYANTIAILFIVALGFFGETIVLARGWILISWFVALLFSVLGRFVFRRWIYFLRAKGYLLSRTLIIGFNDESASMAEQLQFTRNSGLNLIGFVDCEVPKGQKIFKNLICLGPLDELETLIEENKIQEVIITSSALDRSQILEIFQNYGVSSNVNLHLSSGVYEIITTGLKVKEFAWVPLVEVNKVRLTGFDLFIKTVMDYSLTIPGLILASPILLLIAIAIRVDSPGPIIHRRRVMGVNGKEFDAFKFRTMYVNGDEILQRYPEKLEELHKTFKIKDDPRITRVGRFIRKTSLDELPQLFNIIRYEMSLVGPRMISPPEMQEYKKNGLNLLTVKPGITGKWQVSGRSDITYKQRVQMDMYYVRNWNIWLDIQLLLQTIPAVLTKRGAY
ncbi:MAG: glycosyl transferase [Anaerolineaceae bacterium]|nr:glycosyl transferase [Anaerolineaceae bacterium]